MGWGEYLTMVLTTFHITFDHLYVFYRECLPHFKSWIEFFSIEILHSFMLWMLTSFRCIVCKYSSILSFLSALLYYAEAFYFGRIPFVYFLLMFLVLWGSYLKIFVHFNVLKHFPCFILILAQFHILHLSLESILVDFCNWWEVRV